MKGPLDRTHKGFFDFRPIDAAAKSGHCLLLRDIDGGQHCGRWDRRLYNGAWVYSAGGPIAREIVEYCVRQPLEQDAA
jgi:hypothetical protein